MDRGTGTGLIGGGVVLIALGAVMYWGVTVSQAGWFNISNIGLILFWIGIATAVIGAAVLLAGARSRSSTHEDVHRTPSGTERSRESESCQA